MEPQVRRNYTDSLEGETLRSIGQLMVSTSLIDHLLRYALGITKSLDLKGTRRDLGWMPGDKAFRHLRKALRSAGIVIEEIDWRELGRDLHRIYRLRDLVAHCLWVEGDNGRKWLAQTKDGRSDGKGPRWKTPEGMDLVQCLRLGERDVQLLVHQAQLIVYALEELNGRWSRPPQTESDRGSFGMTVTLSAVGFWANPKPQAD